MSITRNKIKFSLKPVLFALGSFYFLVTLPSSLLLFQSEFYRFVTIEQISVKMSHFRNPDYVFVGDSIMGGGRNWWLRLGKPPFSSITIANNGNTIEQITELLDQAIKLRPRYIFVMAGTNDLFQGRSDAQIQADWKNLLRKVRTHNDIKFIITSFPITNYESNDQRISRINEFVSQEAKSNQVDFIDLNEILLSQTNNQRSSYFIDGVHFSDLTYKIWAKEINDKIED